ncbi:hypothetical protein IC235_21290 [Hymenobacter sp. BT664]|uniref:Uncharacterized protein n=1 Tax=Hymenobacter montanus TaxID=2771359 RepID=A0A927BIC5_9BACT|nr:hypothetical protein [Hymenobacter montanus]MBD2770428.1 hypothetical protein [Hymenobacter montanus]
MRAFIDGENVLLEDIELDDLGWDHFRTRGERMLVIELTAEDRMAVGSELFAIAQEYYAEDRAYFEDEDMKNVSVPDSATIFLQNPASLRSYFEENFWKRAAVMALMKRMDACREAKHPRYWIQDFRGVGLDNNKVALEFGVSAQ